MLSAPYLNKLPTAKQTSRRAAEHIHLHLIVTLLVLGVAFELFS